MLCSVKKHETYDAPIKSKEELIFHVGFRQFVGRYGIEFERPWHIIEIFSGDNVLIIAILLQANFL